MRKTLRNIIIRGGVKIKKVRAGVPSLGEVRPHHMCLASYSARVSAAERRKDENCTLDPLFSGPGGGQVGEQPNAGSYAAFFPWFLDQFAQFSGMARCRCAAVGVFQNAHFIFSAIAAHAVHVLQWWKK